MTVGEWNDLIYLFCEEMNKTQHCLDINNIIRTQPKASDFTEYQYTFKLGRYSDLGFTFKDNKRTISDSDAQKLYKLQDGKCAITGNNHDIKELVKGHIISHKNGGRTTIENTVLIRHDLNSDMSSDNISVDMLDKGVYDLLKQTIEI